MKPKLNHFESEEHFIPSVKKKRRKTFNCNRSEC